MPFRSVNKKAINFNEGDTVQDLEGDRGTAEEIRDNGMVIVTYSSGFSQEIHYSMLKPVDSITQVEEGQIP